jgi:predicted transcriptional regulator
LTTAVVKTVINYICSQEERLRKKNVAGQELELLQHVSDHAPITVREVADGFGAEHDLARTTVLTIMERLRKKGFLVRRKSDGIFVYNPAIGKPELMKGVVKDFFEQTLKGSLSPFVAYLGEKKDLTSEELTQLEELVKDLKKEGK